MGYIRCAFVGCPHLCQCLAETQDQLHTISQNCSCRLSPWQGKDACRQKVAEVLWFLASDLAYSIYSLVTDIITIHQVFASGQFLYAYLLLAILLLPVDSVFCLFVAASVRWCHSRYAAGSLEQKVAAVLMGLTLSPLLFLMLHVGLVLYSLGVSLPAWFDLIAMGVDFRTFYRTQSLAESMLNALPQSIIQSKLYIMGNDPHGVHVYIDTRLYLASVVGSLSSVLKSVVVFITEQSQYNHGFLAYVSALLRFEPIN